MENFVSSASGAEFRQFLREPYYTLRNNIERNESSIIFLWEFYKIIHSLSVLYTVSIFGNIEWWRMRHMHDKAVVWNDKLVSERIKLINFGMTTFLWAERK